MTPRQDSKLFRYPHVVTRPQIQQYWKDPTKTIMIRAARRRQTSWAELLFDVVFVAVMMSLALNFEEAFDPHSLFEFIVTFTAAWRLWEAANVYMNRFDVRDALHKVYFFVEMMAVLGLAVHTTRGVAASYLLARGLTEAMSLWAVAFDPIIRRRVLADIVVFLVAAAAWIYSLSEPNSNPRGPGLRPQADILHLSWWMAALVFEIVAHLIVRKLPTLSVPVNIEHLVERFGLFTMLMLGEQVKNLLFFSEHSTSETYGVAIMGGTIVLSIFIVYFEVEAARQRKHAIYRGTVRFQLWYWSHLPFHGAIVAGAFGMRSLIHETGDAVSQAEAHAHSFSRWLFFESLSLVYFSLALFGILNRQQDAVLIRKRYRVALRLVVGLVFFSLGFVELGDARLSASWTIGIACILCSIVGVVEHVGGVVLADQHASLQVLKVQRKSVPHSANETATVTVAGTAEGPTKVHGGGQGIVLGGSMPNTPSVHHHLAAEIQPQPSARAVASRLLRGAPSSNPTDRSS